METKFTANLIHDVSSLGILEQIFCVNKSTFPILIRNKSNSPIESMSGYLDSISNPIDNFLVNYISDYATFMHTICKV